MFVTFEGLDGSGKSTQAELCAAARGRRCRRRLHARARRHRARRGPRSRPARRARRRPGPRRCYAAARAQHVDEVIRPALERGAAVICDRYLDSSVAYQGWGALGLERVLELNLAAVGGLLPDRTFLLVARPAEIGSRLGGVHDRLERESAEFHARAAAAYRDLAGASPSASSSSMPRDPGRARRGGVWIPSRPYLSRPRRSGSHGCAHRGRRARVPPARARRASSGPPPSPRGRAARRPAPCSDALAPRPVLPRAARRDDPHRRRAGAAATTCTCGRSRAIAASISSSTPTA